MDMFAVVEHYGYAVVAGGMFLTAAGVPLPASVLLLAAGASVFPEPTHHDAMHQGLHLWILLPLAWLAATAGDTLLYLGGRYMGWWLLAGMCRVSVDPESCIFRSADYFYKRGPRTLLFAKFVPGLASMAAPLAGSLNMRFARFLRLDATGALAYVSTWMLAGYAFSRFIEDIVWWVRRVGHVMLFVVLGLVVGYAVMYMVSLWRARAYRKVPKMSAVSLYERLKTVDPNRLVIIADVRSHGYYDPGMQRIKNSIRVEPHRLKEEIVALREFMAPECEIYLYCSCVRDTTSARVAHMLEKENCKTTVIEGGMKAWMKAGGAMELVPAGDIRKLPQFE
jgi:membrane protein DedA with SNARE-associated domain/rhodanese-related sulfurtransferase